MFLTCSPRRPRRSDRCSPAVTERQGRGQKRAREIELLAGIKVAREPAARSEGIPAEDARKLIVF
jgi:hypothetical protein